MSEPNADLLIELVRRASPSGQEAAAVAFLVDWMRAHGFAAYVDSAGNAIGIRGPEHARFTLMLLGHIDTVPGQIPVAVRDGVLYGRGSVDAKGALAAFAEAAAQAAPPDGWRVVVAGAVCEETDSRGAYHIRDSFEPDACIIGEPSGVDRVALGYKGHVWFRYTLAQPETHSSRPEPSVGALGAAFWHAIVDWAEHTNQGYARHFDHVVPNLNAINTHSDGLEAVVEMSISFRLPPRLSPDDVRAAIAPLAAPGARLEMDRGVTAYLGAKDNALVRAMVGAIRTQGRRPAFVLKSGTSDMNVVCTRWRCPLIAYGPGDSHLDHTPDEHLPLDDYATAIATLRHFIEHLEPASEVASPQGTTLPAKRRGDL